MFWENRTPFIIIDGTAMIPPEPVKDMKKWCASVGIDNGAWANAVRGYIAEGRVQFFTGLDYRAVTRPYLIRDNVVKLVNKHDSMYPGVECKIYNGVIKGKEGEMWEPTMEVIL